MLPFFRKIRWQLARDNQFFKYSRYAIGEIVLVMVGILLALQVNNWNEKRKNNLKLEVYQTRLIQELIKDTIALHNFLIEINAEAKKWSDIKTEIEKPSATIDTLIGYFVESNIGYMPVFSDKNDATYKSLVSSSEIEFFDEGQRILLMDFYNNIEPQYAFILKWQSEVVYDFEETFSQYGWLTKRNKDNLIF